MEKLRKKIDHIDEQLVKLLDERMGLAFEIGKIKKEKGLPVLDAGRETEVFAHLQALPRISIRDDELQELFEHIIRISRSHGARGLR
ncbi:MAG: chorismate mutase [Candidatus Neomarinimicrobiota bacterium]|jgi:monofunctional chorismate mutase|nr:chorismate mutase [Candidatus Neomarinimicrobiota bacterium]MDD3966735.1 chorismate mutase [Candidatus Neomarinimicrobiota bacterium]MDX9780880.1 chorismate mutase [bacterium]